MLPVGLVLVGAIIQKQEQPSLKVCINVLLLTAAAIAAEQIQHLWAQQNRLKVPLQQGLQQRACCWKKRLNNHRHENTLRTLLQKYNNVQKYKMTHAGVQSSSGRTTQKRGTVSNIWCPCVPFFSNESTQSSPFAYWVGFKHQQYVMFIDWHVYFNIFATEATEDVVILLFCFIISCFRYNHNKKKTFWVRLMQ